MKLLSATLLLAATFATHAQTTTPAQLEQWREQSVHALFIDSPLPPLKPQSFGSFVAAPGVRVEHITFGTQYGMRVPAIVYAPAHPKGRVPALVVVNGHGGDKSSWYAVYTGLLYASAGAVVVTYDPIGEFERTPSRGSEVGEHDKPIPGLNHPERVGGLMIEDAMQAVRYAASRHEVDPKRIALLGYSMGSFHASLAAALAGPQLPHIRALVLSGGGDLDGNGGSWDSSTKINCQGGPYRALSFMPDKGADLYALRARSGPTLVLNGTVDSLVARPNHFEPFFNDLRSRIASLTGSQTNLPETLWFPGVGHRPSWMTRPAALWLNYQLHFPNWTDAEIEAFPTIRVADWVAKTGVRISHGYQVEQKEGGIPALDLQLPGLTREQLQAVPEAVWQKDRSRYTLEGWTPRALAADHGGESTAASSVQSQHP
ncbi:alpha/beta hydrolase family protein [Granulicella mallensis]|uniref:Acetyl xylan esterase n=1 Tax=Granulicella mallensis (strain ATCC BAA-1857 / DSM 23137 / MP5ACTX8) TaxID=682795 RepID=G8NZG1_GRAMM|nr:acetylxylan esterase [Granulicella mallensis]AEU37989.1 Acetyl xylan esterase [Granulicella mallensis MP5ACTX8]